MTQRLGVRVTPQTAAVLAALLGGPVKGLYGLEIAKAVHLPTGSIYPILIRLEQAGWVTGTWEEINPAAAERLRRRYYQLTGLGQRHARQVVPEIARGWWQRLGLPVPGETPA